MQRTPDIALAPDTGAEIAFRLRLVCEAHDPSIASHLDRVGRCACEIARRIGLPAQAIAELEHAAPLHDIGKIGIPLALLNKESRLTAVETEEMQAHTRIGHRILDGSSLPLIRSAAEIALSHHECWNGGGYPRGLAGTQIPLFARIVAVADVYDALLSQRAYKPAWKEDQILAEMRQLRGVKFDPEILDAFLELLPGGL